MKMIIALLAATLPACGQAYTVPNAPSNPDGSWDRQPKSVGYVFVKPHFIEVPPASQAPGSYDIIVKQKGFKGHDFAWSSCLEVTVAPIGYATRGLENFSITPAHGTAVTCKVIFIGAKGRRGILKVQIDG